MRHRASKANSFPPKAGRLAKAQALFLEWLLGLGLVLVTAALYWPATRCDFVNYDDDRYVLDNPHVTGGLTWENIRWACSNPVADNWHPVTVLSHTAACQLFGLNPWGHHLINVLLHALNAGLVFALLRQMTGVAWPSLVVAALFAVHPLRVESVAWVAERKDVLSGSFGLLALMAYARHAESRKQKTESRNLKLTTPSGLSRVTPHVSRPYLLCLGFFALGLMCKPMLVTWPFVMLLLDYWPWERLQLSTKHSTLKSLCPLLAEKLPFFVLAALLSVVTFVVQQRGGPMAAGEHLPLGARIGNASVSYCRYLGKLFWPMDLAVVYPHPGYWPLAKVLLAGGLMLGISALLLVQWRRLTCLLVGWLWFAGTLVPVIGLVQVGGQAMADRYTYLPSLGVLILAVWGGYEWTRHQHRLVPALSVASGGACVLCLLLTRQQLGHWRDGEALFRQAVEVTEENSMAHSGLGAALAEKGRTDEAIRQYQEALRLRPADALAHNNLGNALAREGRVEEAIGQYREAIRLKPDYALPHINLGAAFEKQGRLAEAISQYQEAVRPRPDDLLARNNLANALARQGRVDEAIEQYREAIRLKPNNANAHYNLGIVLVRKGRLDEAISEYREAVRLRPDHVEAHNNLGIALYQQGRPSEAIREFQEALRFKPDYGAARKNLDAALAASSPPAPPPGTATNR